MKIILFSFRIYIDIDNRARFLHVISNFDMKDIFVEQFLLNNAA